MSAGWKPGNPGTPMTFPKNGIVDIMLERLEIRIGLEVVVRSKDILETARRKAR